MNRPRPTDAVQNSRARAVVEAHGRSSLDYFKLLPDRSLFFSADGECFLAYQRALGVRVVLGDPVGPPDKIEGFLRDFLGRMERRGGAVVFLQAAGHFLDVYRRLGLSPVRVGAVAIVDLHAFDLGAPHVKPLRGALRHAERAGLTLRHLMPPIPDEMLARLRDANASWLTIPGRFERGFTVGRFDEDPIRRSPVSLLEDPSGRVDAFANWIPSFASGEATVDLLRRRADAAPGALDALVIEVLSEARRRAFTRFDLGLAPLAEIPGGPVSHPAERVLRWIFLHADPLFGYRRIHAWKSKFHPFWEPRWLVYRGGPVAFARAAWAVRRVARR